jgi:dTDP-4-dehydrorhamnose reductase
VVLIGSDGMLGRAWDAHLTERGVAFSSPRYPGFDMTARDQVATAIPRGTTLVINCAAWTDVDGAETREADATRVNGMAAGFLAERCAASNATLIHYSTDYVFSGQADLPYRTDHPVEPVNAYGRGKADGEARILASGCQHLIARTSWLYAPWGNNFVSTITKLARDRPTLRVVNDQHGRPTSAEHLAQTSLQLLERAAHGIYHITDGGQCSWFEFAVAIAARASPECRVEPCTSAEFKRPARRPEYSVLDLSQTEAVVGPMPPWQDNLAAVLDRTCGITARRSKSRD